MNASDAFAGLESVPVLIVVGALLFFGVFAGRLARRIRLPGLMGFMFLGIVLGPSGLGVLSHGLMDQLGFVTELALGFVALAIGFELSFKTLRRQGPQLVRIVVWESLLTFFLVSAVVFALTRYAPLSILFGAVAVTTAPAGKMAVIQENNARGPFTRALLAVVGFDDAAAIIIFGFALAIVKYLLALEFGGGEAGMMSALLAPVLEIGLSLVIGVAIGLTIGSLARRLGQSRDVFILTLASVFLVAGLSEVLPISMVLTAMVAGIAVTNTQPHDTTEQIGSHVTEVTPFMFVLFFGLAGAHLDLTVLPQLGVVGTGYILARSLGKIGGCWIGGRRGNASPEIRRYLGISILSQAGLAIGLTLIALQELAPLGPEAEAVARTVIVTITASSVIFELIGPVLTKYSLGRAGEIHAGR